jgi:hypothetical protein
MLDKILCYFLEDPLRLIYLLGGSGGLWNWLTIWRNRIRMRIVVKKETFDLVAEPNLRVTAEYEIENISENVTSLSPTVLITGYTPDRKFMKSSFQIEDLDRELPPFKPKLFRAEFELPATYPFLLLRTYTFTPTRGSKSRIMVWSACLLNISRVKFMYELLLFKLFGKYSKPRA